MSGVELNKTSEVVLNNPKGAIAWMGKNPVAANLAMLIILIGGIVAALNIKQEIFPAFDLDMVAVTCVYPGASPSEVEQGILLAVEEAVRGADGVKKITSTANEGMGVVMVEMTLGANPDKVLSDVKNSVDRITTFPVDMEKPTVASVEPTMSVVSVLISGEEPHGVLHGVAEKVRADLLRDPHISQVEVSGVKNLEISVEVSRETLESYGITLGQIAQQIKAYSVELPSGSVDTKTGTVLVRVADKKLTGDQFENIVIRGTASGAEVRLGDIAKVTDHYADQDLMYKYNGKPSVMVTAYRAGTETPLKVAGAVKKYLKEKTGVYPKSISFAIWDDYSSLLAQRIDLLLRNARSGMILVVIALGLFLQRRIAFWVAFGIPTSFLGAFLLMPAMGASINMITLFALIVVLGMVVDDAIVVSENIFHKLKRGEPPLKAAIEGTQEMIVPVTFSVLTTVAAFSPLMFIPGVMGKIFFFIPVVVILVLVFSMVESFFILPAHLGHGGSTKKPNWLFHKIDQLQEFCNAQLDKFLVDKYQPLLKKLLRHRYYAMAGAFAMLILVVATVPAGILKFQFFSKVDGEVVTASGRLPFGIPVERTEAVAKIIQEAADKTVKEMGGESIYRGSFTRIGESGSGPSMGAQGSAKASHLLSVQVDLGSADDRTFGSSEFSERWKKNLPPLPELESFSVGSLGGPSGGKDVDVKLSHSNIALLGEASIWLADRFRELGDLTDVENSFTGGKPQLDFALRPGASAAGITSMDIASTLRNSFYGVDAVKQQRGRNEIKVTVRLPENQRSSEYDLEQMLIATKQGTMMPLSAVAEMKRGTAPTEITREEGVRQVHVSADLVPGAVSGGRMIALLEGKVAPGDKVQDKMRSARGKPSIEREKAILQELKEKFPGVQYSFGGQQESTKESMGALLPNFMIALLVIFTLLAIPFKNYYQPFIVMTAIPFGIVGAFVGHILLGYNLGIMSIMGIVALSGVVVNDSLVLVDAVNKYRSHGMTVYDALVRSGIRRFRPIMLTSVTTFFGLMPMIFETSMQAKFLIPMALSLGFGILFSTVIVLLIVPVLYIFLERIRFRFGMIQLEEIGDLDEAL